MFLFLTQASKNQAVIIKKERETCFVHQDTGIAKHPTAMNEETIFPRYVFI